MNIPQAGWSPRFYQSGTMIVVHCDVPSHYYLYGPGNADEDAAQRDRAQMCRDLADYLNGGHEPKWLADMKRVSDGYAMDIDGSSIRATGPSVDTNPPHCFWVEDNSPEAVACRKHIMDHLFPESEAHNEDS